MTRARIAPTLLPVDRFAATGKSLPARSAAPSVGEVRPQSLRSKGVNASVRERLIEFQNALIECRSDREALDRLRLLIERHGDDAFRYDFHEYARLSAQCLFLIIATHILLLAFAPGYAWLSFVVGIPIIGLATWKVLKLIWLRRGTRSLLIRKVVWPRHSLREHDVEPLALNWAEERFPEFHRGDEGQLLTTLASATWGTGPSEFAVRLHEFSYVMVTRQEVYDSQTNTWRTEEHRHFEFRHGLVFRCASHGTVHLNVASFDAKQRWKTAYPEFEKRFSVRATSEFAASRFLTPVIQTAMVDAASALGGITLTITAHGDACLAFNDGDWLDFGTPHQLDQSRALYRALLGKTDLPKLACARQLVETIHSACANPFAQAT